MRIDSNTHLDYDHLSVWGALERAALAAPKYTALDFFDRRISFKEFTREIQLCVRAFAAQGVRAGDTVTICLPNCPQALYAFYAASYLGATANMLHPQSAQNEIKMGLELTDSPLIVTLDMFYETVAAAVRATNHPVTIVMTRMEDELPAVAAAAYVLTNGKKYAHLPFEGEGILWKDFLKAAKNTPLPEAAPFAMDHTAVILYSGGTSGKPKGIALSDYSFNACAKQAHTSIAEPFEPGYSMLSCMPCFHGFGLGMNLHAALIYGVTCILMPSFNIKTYAKMLTQKKPNYLAGVPTIFEALLHLPGMEKVSLSFLKGMFCGGDTLPVALKREVDAFLREHGAAIQIREGYGLTECVTACCLTPRDEYREGSIGLPFPDTPYAIVRPGTTELLPVGEVGEIILTGPTLMQEYVREPEETAETLRVLPDGRTWLYTGDLGCLDADGFVYFKGRIKRMIITNGYNVYPAELERVLLTCEDVQAACVVGVPDPRRIHKVKAYVVLKDGATFEGDRAGASAMKEKLLGVMELSVAKYALPREFVFVEALPLTDVGKVNYKELEERG